MTPHDVSLANHKLQSDRKRPALKYLSAAKWGTVIPIATCHIKKGEERPTISHPGMCLWVVELHSLESSQPDPPSTVNPCLQAGRQGTMGRIRVYG